MKLKFWKIPDLDGDSANIKGKDISPCGVNITLLNGGGIQVHIMRAFADGGDIQVNAENWRLLEESDEWQGQMNLTKENKVIDSDLFELEREISHLTSDIPTYDLPIKETRNSIAIRLQNIRNDLRDRIRKKGYKGTF